MGNWSWCLCGVSTYVKAKGPNRWFTTARHGRLPVPDDIETDTCPRCGESGGTYDVDQAVGRAIRLACLRDPSFAREHVCTLACPVDCIGPRPKVEYTLTTIED